MNMIRIQHNPFSALVPRNLIVGVVILGLFNLGIPHGSAAVERLSVKSESQVRSEAGLYDTAIREISRIETMKLQTADDFKPVRAILERQVPNLRFQRSKLVALGLSETSFVSAAKARTSDRAKAEEFARELAADNQSIFRLAGAQSFKDKINRAVRADISLLVRVSDRLQRAADEIKSKSPAHHGSPSLELPNALSSPQRNPVVEFYAAIVVTSLVISVVMIVSPLAAVALVYLASAVVGGLVTAAIINGAATLVARVATNVGTEQGRDRVAECLEQADARFAECARQGAFVTALTCFPQYLLAAARCLTAE